MQCPDCFKKEKIEVEMDHEASYRVINDTVEYEEWCPRCGTCFKGILTREKDLARWMDENYGR